MAVIRTSLCDSHEPLESAWSATRMETTLSPIPFSQDLSDLTVKTPATIVVPVYFQLSLYRIAGCLLRTVTGAS
jgi:hypothetical protein